jgi:hypothetical protein
MEASSSPAMNKKFTAQFDQKVVLFLLLSLLLFLTAILMFQGNPMDNLPGRDNGVFLYGGQQILQGKIPYLDFWDHKGPLIHYINALGLLIGSGSRWGVWGVEFVFLFFAGWGIFQVARDQWGGMAALITLAAWGYGIFVGGSYYHFHDSNYTETYSLLFNVLSVYIWIKALRSPKNDWHYMLIGILAGFSFLLRPNNIGVHAAIVLTLVVDGLRSRSFSAQIRKLVLLGIGGSIVLAGCVIYFHQMKALPELIDSVIFYNMVYRHSGISSMLGIAGKGFSIFNWLPLIGYVVILFYYVRRKKSASIVRDDFGPSEDATGSTFIFFLLIGLPIEAIATSMSGRILLHYYITWIPYLSWLVGAAVFMVVGPSLKKMDRLPLSIPILVVLLVLVVLNMPTLKKYSAIANRILFDRSARLEKDSVIVNYVADQTEPGDKVLVWGNDLWINFDAGRESPTRYGYQYPLFMKGYTDKEKVAEFLAELQSAPPKLIVEPVVDTSEILPLNFEGTRSVEMPDGMDAVFGFIEQNYCVKARFHDIVVYQLTGGSSCQ